MLSPQYSTYAAMSKLNYELAIFQTYLSNETLIADNYETPSLLQYLTAYTKARERGQQQATFH